MQLNNVNKFSEETYFNLLYFFFFCAFPFPFSFPLIFWHLFDKIDTERSWVKNDARSKKSTTQHGAVVIIQCRLICSQKKIHHGPSSGDVS